MKQGNSFFGVVPSQALRLKARMRLELFRAPCDHLFFVWLMGMEGWVSTGSFALYALCRGLCTAVVEITTCAWCVLMCSSHLCVFVFVQNFIIYFVPGSVLLPSAF